MRKANPLLQRFPEDISNEQNGQMSLMQPQCMSGYARLGVLHAGGQIGVPSRAAAERISGVTISEHLVHFHSGDRGGSHQEPQQPAACCTSCLVKDTFFLMQCLVRAMELSSFML